MQFSQKSKLPCFRYGSNFLEWRIYIPFSLMWPILWCHNATPIIVEATKIVCGHKYNIPILSPFTITIYPLVTFDHLSPNVDKQPPYPNYRVEIRFLFIAGMCLTYFSIQSFPLFNLIRTLPFPTILHGSSSPNKTCPKSPEHNHERISYGV